MNCVNNNIIIGFSKNPIKSPIGLRINITLICINLNIALSIGDAIVINPTSAVIPSPIPTNWNEFLDILSRDDLILSKTVNFLFSVVAAVPPAPLLPPLTLTSIAPNAFCNFFIAAFN